jgi:O-succinylbenzoic acid--CoA ligase
MDASAKLTAEALKLQEGMTALLCLDPTFIAGKMMVVRCMVIGMQLITVKPVANPLDHITDTDTKIDFAAMVPLQVHTILDSHRAEDLNKIGTIIIGGGQVDDPLRARLSAFHTRFFSTFGMTETISHVALQKLNGADASQYMRALPGVRLSTDERGCLIIKAPFISKSPLVTNDVVELIDQERFRWLGRWDNVINSGGVKVMPEAVEPVIEQLLAGMGIHQRFFVYGRQHPSLGSEVVLVMEGVLEDDIEESILAAMKNQLPKHSAPRRIAYAENFLFTSTGKIRRKESFGFASPRPGLPRH